MQKLTKAQYNQWLIDLRSGEYKKSIGILCDIGENGNKYCCLGVLNDRIKAVDPNKEWLTVIKDYKSVSILIDSNMQTTLANLNDGDKSFSDVASDLLEDDKYDEEIEKQILALKPDGTHKPIADFIEIIQNNKLYEFYEEVDKTTV